MGLAINFSGVADDRWERHLRSQLSEGLTIAVNEGRAFEKIEG